MLTQLAAIARRTGFPVVEVKGWKTRGRPGGMSDVRTITCHHTANGGARGNYPSLRVVRDGRPGLPGPLAQYGLGIAGTIYVIAAGKSNHAGTSRSVDYLNSHAVGIEAEAVGIPGTKGDWPPAQMDAYARLCAALVDELGLTAADVRGHKETCAPVGRKSDPSFAMDAHRRRIAAVNLKIKPAQEDSDMKLTDEVDLTPQAEKLLGQKTATVRELLQWPPGVRAARDEIERVRDEQVEQTKALRAEIAAQGALLAQILERLPGDPAH
jgi:hypothetical protein